MTATAPALPVPAGPGASVPCWSSRALAAGDRSEVLALFTEPDFYYRTERPDTRPEWEILEFLGDDTRLLLAGGRLAGLFAVEALGLPHICHYQLHLRLQAAAPLAWWISAYQEVVRAIRWRREVIRLAMRFPEFDERGLRFARAAGLTDEGTLAGVIVHAGRHRGQVFFAQTWEPST
jgi:hypothetical protein